MSRTVQPDWCGELAIQQQSVLFLAARGPDGIPKTHPCKDVQRAYRATVLLAARYGRPQRLDDKGDTFMSLTDFADDAVWDDVIHKFFLTVDELPHHFLMHLMHGAEIIGYHHPDVFFRARWIEFYERACKDLHLTPETQSQMDERLNDWGQEEWTPTLTFDHRSAPLSLTREVDRLTDHLHKLRAHPDYEYATTECGRKQGPAPEPEGEGWEDNVHSDDPHSCWERFDWHEEHYWRRRKPQETTT